MIGFSRFRKSLPITVYYTGLSTWNKIEGWFSYSACKQFFKPLEIQLFQQDPLYEEKKFVKISWSTCANPIGFFPTKVYPKHLLCTAIVPLKTIKAISV